MARNRVIVNRSTQEATPERMIRVDALNPRPLKCDPNEKFDYENVLLPKAVIEGISQDTHGLSTSLQMRRLSIAAT